MYLAGAGMKSHSPSADVTSAPPVGLQHAFVCARGQAPVHTLHDPVPRNSPAGNARWGFRHKNSGSANPAGEGRTSFEKFQDNRVLSCHICVLEMPNPAIFVVLAGD